MCLRLTGTARFFFAARDAGADSAGLEVLQRVSDALFLFCSSGYLVCHMEPYRYVW
jgi:hypothetical protein